MTRSNSYRCQRGAVNDERGWWIITDTMMIWQRSEVGKATDNPMNFYEITICGLCEELERLQPTATNVQPSKGD